MAQDFVRRGGTSWQEKIKEGCNDRGGKIGFTVTTVLYAEKQLFVSR